MERRRRNRGGGAQSAALNGTADISARLTRAAFGSLVASHLKHCLCNAGSSAFAPTKAVSSIDLTNKRLGIFEPLQRLHDRTTTGLGLGLAIARGFLQAMGGQIRPTDTPGGGLTMIISVPTADHALTSGTKLVQDQP